MIQTYEPIRGMFMCVVGGKFVKTRDYLAELEKEKEKAEVKADEFRTEIDRLTDMLAKRNGEKLRLEERVEYFLTRYKEEVEYSKRVEKKVSELDERLISAALRIRELEEENRTHLTSIEIWRGQYHKTFKRVKELEATLTSELSGGS